MGFRFVLAFAWLCWLLVACGLVPVRALLPVGAPPLPCLPRVSFFKVVSHVIQYKVFLAASRGLLLNTVLLVKHTHCVYLVVHKKRPPGKGKLEAVSIFREEYDRLASEALGVLVVGDLNVHNARWLR